MKYTFLTNISNYARENNIPFDSIPINLSMFPYYFRRLVKLQLLLANPNYVTREMPDFLEIKFDSDKNAYLSIVGIDNRTTLAITINGLKYKEKMIGRKIPESRMYETIIQESPNVTSINDHYIRDSKTINEKLKLINNLNKNICDYMGYLNDMYNDYNDKPKQYVKKASINLKYLFLIKHFYKFIWNICFKF